MGNRKKGICMADGGITQESPEQLMARMAAKYGAPTGTTQQAQPQQQSTQQAPQQPQQKSGGLGIMSMLKGRSAQIDKAASGYAAGGMIEQQTANTLVLSSPSASYFNAAERGEDVSEFENRTPVAAMADGGIAGHVKFEGKGGPREDQIPVKVAGQKINVSNGEQALIIPAKTAANAQAMEMIKKIIADSNDGRQPDMGHGDSNFAEGGLLDDEARKMNYQAVTGVQASAPTPQPAVQPNTGGWSLGKSGPGANLQVTTGDAARLPAPAVQQGIATMRSQLAAPQAPAQVSQPATSEARPWYAGASSADSRTGLEMERERRAQASNEGVLNDPVKSALKYGVVGQPKQNSATQLAGSNYGNEGRSVPTEITKDNPGSVSTDKAAPNVQAAANSNESTLDGRQGAHMVENNLREFRDVGAGITAQRGQDGKLSITNIGTSNITDPNNRGLDDSAAAAARHADDVKNGRTPQQVYERMVRNRMLSDLTDPTITDPSVRANAANYFKLMGDPADNQLKQAQAQGIMATTESAQMLADIQKKALAGDPQAAASYRALTGKGGTENMRDNFMAVGGGQEFDATANVMRNVPQRLIDLRTGQEVGGQAKQQGPSQAAKPSYEQFSAQMKQRHGDKATDAAMKQAYAKQFGA